MVKKRLGVSPRPSLKTQAERIAQQDEEAALAELEAEAEASVAPARDDVLFSLREVMVEDKLHELKKERTIARLEGLQVLDLSDDDIVAIIQSFAESTLEAPEAHLLKLRIPQIVEALHNDPNEGLDLLHKSVMTLKGQANERGAAEARAAADLAEEERRAAVAATKAAADAIALEREDDAREHKKELAKLEREEKMALAQLRLTEAEATLKAKTSESQAMETTWQAKRERAIADLKRFRNLTAVRYITGVLTLLFGVYLIVMGLDPGFYVFSMGVALLVGFSWFRGPTSENGIEE